MTTDRNADLERLHDDIRRCTACRLHRGRTQAVPGEGKAGTPVMLIGEAPGREEDLQGRPFCGRAGRAFDEALDAINLPREDTYVTSTVKCRPPENRTPRQDEMDTCYGRWMSRQIELVSPRLIVLLGRVPIGQLTGERGRLRDVHGQVRLLAGRRCLLTYHPAAAMRFPEPELGLREDFRTLACLLREEGIRG